MASRFKGLVWNAGMAAALLLAAPALAQENSTSTVPPPAPAENIGPRELSNFNLSGTVTRQAQPDAQPPASPARETSARTAAPAQAEVDRPAPVRSAATAARPTQSQPNPALSPVSTRPGLRQGANAATGAASAAPALAIPVTSPPLPTEAPSGFSPLPWLAALLLLGAGAAIYFGRQRQKGRYATASVSEFLGEAAQPQPAAPALAPRPAAQPAPQPAPRTAEPQAPRAVPSGLVNSDLRKAPAAPPGLVTSTLRPWIELELEPSQAMVTDEHAAIAFDVTLFNSGSAPARDVAIEACLINAGQQQDAELTQFYTTPGAVRDKIPAVAPMARITLKSAVRLPREAVQEYEVEGRKLFMPMVAVNSRYRWSSGEGQSAASFLVGRGADDSDRLGPLRLDQGRRGWKGLAARRYEKGIRR